MSLQPERLTVPYTTPSALFYRAFNAIFGKVGRVASEDVVMELLKTKRLPIVYYGFEACPLNKSQIHSLEFALNSCLRKIFNTRSQDVVVECMTLFNCLSVEDSLLKRKCKFMSKLGSSKNLLYMLLLTMLQENSLCFRDDEDCNGLFSLLILFALVKNF